jgi:hypothetical protein
MASGHERLSSDAAPRQLMQRQVACDDDQLGRGHLNAGRDRGHDTIVHALQLRLLDVAERKDIFVEETLLRQSAKEFDAIVVNRLPIVLDRSLQQAAADRGQQSLKFKVMDDPRLQQRQQHGVARHCAHAVGPEQFGKPQLSRPASGEAPQRCCHRGALLDEYLRVAQAERLVGDGDVVVGGRIGAVELERLAEQFHRQFVAAALLHHVAQQHEAVHMAGITIERQATIVFRLNELSFAVIRYSFGVNIVGFGGFNRPVGRSGK